MNTKGIILGIGELLWDMLPTGKKPGGAPGNFTYHAGQLGYESYMISAVGDDPPGKGLTEALAKKGVNTDYISTLPDYPTGEVLVLVDETGIPLYDIPENRAWDHIPWLDTYRPLLARARALCFGTLAQRNTVSRETICRILEEAPQACLKVFDINLRQHYYSRETIESSLRLADLLKLNEEELTMLSGMLTLPPERQAAAAQLIDRFGLQMVVITNGGTDSLIHDGRCCSILPTPQIEIADTVGAGDSFTAAVVTGYMDGKPLEAIHRRAVEVAAFVSGQPGAMPLYPRKKNVTEK